MKKRLDNMFEGYLDDNEEFYDYGTAVYTGDGNVIDTKHTGISFYDQFLGTSELDYLHNNKNLKGDIIMMSPQEYYEECAYKIFNTSVAKLKRERGEYDRIIIDKLHKVLTVYKRKLCMPMLNYAHKGQEGLHRMLAIAEVLGWNHKVPVLVIDWYDEERHNREVKEARKHRIDTLIERAITETLYYHFTDLGDLTTQLQSELLKQFKYEEDIFVPEELDIKETNESIILTFMGNEYPIDREEIKWREDEVEDELDDIDITADEDFIVRYFGKDWETTHPHLKDTFGINEELEQHDDIVYNCAQIARDYIVTKYGEGTDLCGRCIEASDYLVSLFNKNGIEAKTVEGYIIYDNDETCSDRAWDEHTWVELSDGTVVDVTVEQFNLMMDNDYPPILIQKNPYNYVYQKPSFTWLDELNDSSENLNTKQVDEHILNNWGSKHPGEGCIFIHPDGEFINIYPKLDDHEDLCYWLEDQGFEGIVEDAEWFVEEFNYVRCRNSLHLCFVDLPKSITTRQLNSLADWMETKVRSTSIQVSVPHGKWKKYSTDQYFPEDIIKLIKRYYSCGTLYENLGSKAYSK